MEARSISDESPREEESEFPRVTVAPRGFAAVIRTALVAWRSPRRSAAMRRRAVLGEQRRYPAASRTNSYSVSETRSSPDPGSGGSEFGQRTKSASQERI